MRIRTKALLIFSILSLVPLAVIGVIAYKNGEETIKESLGVSFQQIAHETIDKVDRSLYEVYHNVQTWAGLDLMQEVITGDVDGKISSFLIGLNKEYGSFSSLDALNRDGELVASSDPAMIGKTLAQEAPYLGAVRGRAYVSDVQFDAMGQTWVATFAFPIEAKFEEHRLIGVLVAKWKADELFSMTQLRKTGTEPYQARVLLMRSDGLLIAAPAHEQAQVFVRNVLDVGLVAAQGGSRGETGYLVERDERGTMALIGYDYSKGYRDFPGLGWVALVVQDVKTAFAPIERLKLMTLGVGATVAVCVIAISLILTRRVTDPILKIAQVASRVARGDFEGRVASTSRDEIGSLAKTFNRMIEDLKQQRAQLVEKNYVDNIISSMSDALIVVDPQATIRTANHAACALLGYREDELIGQPLDMVFPFGEAPFQGQPLDGPPERWLSTHVEKTYRSKDGRTIPVLFSSSVMRDQRGKTEGIVCVAQDITELKRAQEQLKEITKELTRSNQELEQFAYVASHDLQEPLRMVASYTKLLERRYKDRLDRDANEFITFAVDGATRMQRLIQDLLEYSRVGTRGEPFEPTDCLTVFDQAVANLHVAVEEHHATITHEALPSVMADASQLVRLFQNLIGNAIKFRSQDAPRVHVSAEPRETEWIFRVRDNGIGIDAKYADRIFSIFQRLHTAVEYPGTGIGLAVCKKIVERHGGRIWVESEPGNGSTFSFTLPGIPPRLAQGHSSQAGSLNGNEAG